MRMFYNRPRTATVHKGHLCSPITLLHGQFVDDCKDCLPTPKLACFVLDLATEMCKFYKNEADRRQAFRDLICDPFEIKLTVESRGSVLFPPFLFFRYMYAITTYCRLQEWYPLGRLSPEISPLLVMSYGVNVAFFWVQRRA
jgi:hypothetical protein